MARLRVTLTLEYEADPKDYGVTTLEEAVAEARAALNTDLIGTIASLGDGGKETLTVEVVT